MVNTSPVLIHKILHNIGAAVHLFWCTTVFFRNNIKSKCSAMAGGTSWKTSRTKERLLGPVELTLIPRPCEAPPPEGFLIQLLFLKASPYFSNNAPNRAAASASQGYTRSSRNRCYRSGGQLPPRPRSARIGLRS